MLDTDRITRIIGLPAVTVTVIDDLFTDDVTIRARQDLDDPRGPAVCFQGVPGQLLADGASAVEYWVAQSIARQLRPWLRPDPPAIPHIDLFPALTRRRHRARGITRKIHL